MERRRMVAFTSMEVSHREIAPDMVVVTIAGKVMMGPESEQITTIVNDLLGQAKRIIIFDIAGITKIDSTGIGRFICSYNQVAAAGGEIRMAEAPRFVFQAFSRLPAGYGVPVLFRRGRSLPGPVTPMRNANTILIVDDDPDIHHLLAAALREENYLIEDRYDGLEALSLLESQACDLVITDVRMPGLDGLELLRRIHKVRPATKVLVMTAEVHRRPSSAPFAIKRWVILVNLFRWTRWLKRWLSRFTLPLRKETSR